MQVVSDFGFFGRKKAEEFLGSFEDIYCLRQYRIGGDSVRCLSLQCTKTSGFSARMCHSCHLLPITSMLMYS